MKDNFEIRLDFKPNTGSPERVFLAMAEYVSAFENLVYVVGQGIDPESEVSCELSAVETGSLKSIVGCIGNYCWLFVTSCGFGLIEQAAHRAANQIDHGDEVGLVPVATCP